MKTLDPKLIKEWHPTKNGDLLPHNISPSSQRKVWWCLPYDDPKTGKHFDFEWEASVCTRSSGTGCPFLCGRAVWLGFNDLATACPELASEWNWEKNGSLKPSEVAQHSNKKVWWKCHICGAEWEAQINCRTRTNSNCCPKCARAKSYITRHQKKVTEGRTLTNLFPELAAEWDYEKNGSLTPDDVTPADHRIVWWRCKRCNHSWKAKIANRTYLGNGCQRCTMRFRSSFPEQAIYYYLKQIYKDTVSSDHHLGVELDIYIPSKKIGIEYDGERWHKDNERVKSDNKKNQVCIDNKVLLYRIREIGNEVLVNDSDNYIKIIPCERKNDNSLQDAIVKLIKEINTDYTVDIDLTRDRG